MPINEWTPDELENIMEFADEDTVIVPDCDDFIIGMTVNNQFIYDWRAIIANLETEQGMNLEEAMEWFDYNINIYPIEKSPVFQNLFIVKENKRDKFRKTYGKNVGVILI